MQAQQKGINWQECLRRTNNDEELAKELLTLFYQELPSVKQKLQTAEKQQDLASLATVTHKLQGACIYCGLKNLQQLASAIEDRALQKDNAAINPLLNELYQEVELINQQLVEQYVSNE